ncbi:PREDICTED: slo-interacting protein 1 isoform X1 [Drosophila arizonae]|uniref:Slo-interacting protein 1 isoform X1 n=1 Tax=Drosophila arizonae TaxID=7263 RepID=A0ABM1PQ31_DROAR|nr:PREDICTED: slo-interacting protein 1 isoform X1 [Drosophila arizonae]
MCSNNCVVELDYVVLKLNGSDITSLSSYEAVQMFLQAKETLVVELCRKRNPVTSGDLQKDDICSRVKNVQVSNAKATSASENINFNSLPMPPLSVSAENQIILTLRTFQNSDQTEPVSKEKKTNDKFVAFNKTNKKFNHNENIAQTIADHFIEQEHHLFEQCLEPEIDIEEVTLVKNDSTNDEIGLTVSCNNFYSIRDCEENIINPVICNQNADLIRDEADVNTDADVDADADACDDVFISDIQPESLAERDGRLRRGDQILRINGIDIKSKKHAETQIAENTSSVTLLVSRVLYPEDDDDDVDEDDEEIDSNFDYANSILSDEYTNVVDKLDKLLVTQQRQTSDNNLTTESAAKPIKSILPATFSGSQTMFEKSKNKGQTQTSVTEKLYIGNVQGMSHETDFKPIIDKSLRTTIISKEYDYDDCEHIYETIPEDSESEPLYCSPYQSSNYMTAMGSCSSRMMAESDVLEMQQQTQRVAQWLGIKSQLNARSVHTMAGRPSLYHKQQHRISNRVYTLRSAKTNTSESSSSGANCSATNGDNENKCITQQQEEVENSSSAYNTGGSNNSASPHQNAINLEVEPISLSAATANTTPNNPITSFQPVLLPFIKSGRIVCSQHSSETVALNKISADELHPFASIAKIDAKTMRPKPNEEQQSPCPQFNAPNLSRYHFVSSQEVANKTLTTPKTSSILGENVSKEIPMVWKVKRRPDGTRYIVKRPVRNMSMGIRKNIRNNEITTTEDDTISEVKIGRYWTKEERKRHIERARERRHHQQLLHQQQQQQFPTQ